MKFRTYTQYDSSDCGATCLRMIARYYGKKLSQDFFHSRLSTIRSGTSLLHICEQANLIGLENMALAMTLEELHNEATLPCIVHWKKTHFVVVTKIRNNKVYVADPAFGLMIYDTNEFLQNWVSITAEDGISQGIVLLLEPNSEFYKIKDDSRKGNPFKFIFKYLLNYKKVIIHLFFSLLVSSIILLIIPFLSQAIVDIGIKEKNVNFIYVILLAQLALLAGRTILDFIRRRFLLHMSARVNLSLMSDFFKKLENGTHAELIKNKGKYYNLIKDQLELGK
jgi:ATP-binding cassette subfamily B protein